MNYSTYQKLRNVKPMAKQNKKSSSTPSLISAACASVLCLSTAFADDTEVFFGQVDPNLDIFPNVMFVLDTSGSMMEKDNTSHTRLDRMKDALGTILDNTTNVNVGIMRLNGSSGGGAVLFPVTPIDKQICLQDECGEISVSPKVTESNSDSEENITTGNNTFGGNDLGIGTINGDERIVGLHFRELPIPQGAKITSAVLEFTSNNTETSDANFNIYGELSPSAAAFTGANAELSSRPPTNATVNWPIDESWQFGETYQSEQISSILQEIVNQDDWCGDNSLALMLTGTGTRSAQSFDNSPSAAPQLKFTYDSSNIPAGGGCVSKTHVSAISASSDDAEQRLSNGKMFRTSDDLDMPYSGRNEQLIGLRFIDIKIPKGATVTSASIEFQVDAQRYGDVSLNIHGHATGDAWTFGSNRRDISNRSRTGASVAWDDIPNLAVNEFVATQSLVPIAQEIVNRGDWSSGNAMAFIFSRKSGNGIREFETVDEEPVNAAKLRIEYQATSSSSSEATVITARDKLKEVVNGLTAVGGTPIVDAYYEAAQYFRGGAVDYGRKRGNRSNNWEKYVARYHRVSVPESYSGGDVYRDQRCTDGDLDNYYCGTEVITDAPVYNTPFSSSCQTNHIVFLSDGDATSNSAKAKVKALTGKSTCEETFAFSQFGYPEDCGVELAEWLFDTDHSGSMIGKQNISTYTIGFNISSAYLESISSAGGGDYYRADSSAQLVDVFQSILGDVLSVDTSFVAPGATVNQFNRLTHRNDIYFGLFKPATTPVWQGNLKRYEIGADDSGEVTISDVAGKPAVDVSSGFFADDAKSWWSNEVDGSQVSKGGAAAELYFSDSNPRKVFTYVGDYTTIPATGEDLTKTSNALTETNNAITLAHLGIENAEGTDANRADYREALLKWARGIDVQDDNEDNDTTDWRMHMGDPMHARPVILNYENGDTPSTTIFVGTNSGYLHAIDRDEGKELYSYVPKELLDNFTVLWNNQSSDGHPYGLDGTLSVWHEDTDNNVTIDSGEQAYVYTGMRRGGSSYYAMDVSLRDTPKLAWVIDQTTPGFSELGQTWSKMTPTKIRYNGDELDVLIFGAGYSVNQDETLDANYDRIARSEDDSGRGIYIVDAKTGSIIYSMLGSDRVEGGGGKLKFDKMNYSMPSDIRVLDTNFDGFADQLYASDVGGQVWRFDFERYHLANSSVDLVQGGIIADLNSTSLAGERRFYYEPDVAIISNEGERFLSISIGSGWRAHPLDLTVDDRFFMIKSPSVFKAPKGYGKTTDGGKTYTPITIADLIEVNGITNPVINDYGWMYDLNATGEKVLGAAVTADNKVFFTTYRPALAVGACTTAIGGGSIYALNILNGSAILDLNGDGVVDKRDDEKQLAQGGIPPPPIPIITTTKSGKAKVGIITATDLTDPDIDGLTKRTFWADIESSENLD